MPPAFFRAAGEVEIVRSAVAEFRAFSQHHACSLKAVARRERHEEMPSAEDSALRICWAARHAAAPVCYQQAIPSSCTAPTTPAERDVVVQMPPVMPARACPASVPPTRQARAKRRARDAKPAVRPAPTASAKVRDHQREGR